jgi:hypothetical protein
MVLEDWSMCPSCEFPALYMYFKEMLSKTSQCPMCMCTLQADKIILATNAEELLRGAKERIETAKTPDEEDEATGAKAGGKTSQENQQLPGTSSGGMAGVKPMSANSTTAKSYAADQNMPFGAVSNTTPFQGVAPAAAGTR